MSFYLDTNVIVSLFRSEPGTATAVDWFRRAPAPVFVSDFGALEFAAVLSREVRIGAIGPDQAHSVLAKFDTWKGRGVNSVQVRPSDMPLAEVLVRDFATKLLAPDALHLALAIRLEATLVTLDRRLAEAATMRNVSVVRPE